MNGEDEDNAEEILIKYKNSLFMPISYTIEKEFIISFPQRNNIKKMLRLRKRGTEGVCIDDEWLQQQNIQTKVKEWSDISEFLPDLPVYSLINTERKKVKISKSSKSYLIVFVDLFCPISQLLLNQISLACGKFSTQNLLKLVIIIISNGNSGLKQLENYHFVKEVKIFSAGPLGIKSKSARICGVTTIPQCFLIESSQIIYKLSMNSESCIEELNTLLEDPILISSKIKDLFDYQITTQEAFNLHLTSLTQLYLDFLQSNPEAKLPDLSLFFRKTLTKTSQHLTSFATTYSEISKKDHEVGEAFEDLLREIYPRILIGSSYVQKNSIKRGQICNICDNVLEESSTQYLCLFCKPDHYHCESCEKFARNANRLAHLHYLYKLTADSDNLNEIREINIKENDLSPESFQNSVHIGVTCERCMKNDRTNCWSISGTRYKCSHCFDFDLCESCESSFTENSTFNLHSKSHVFIVMHYALS